GGFDILRLLAAVLLVEKLLVEAGLLGRQGRGRGELGRRFGKDGGRRRRGGLDVPFGLDERVGGPIARRFCCHRGGSRRGLRLPGFGLRLVSVFFFQALSRRAHPPWTQGLLLFSEPSIGPSEHVGHEFKSGKLSSEQYERAATDRG